MGIRFAKSIKLGDLVKVNISKSGLSATIGKKGASINLGSKGTYLNLSPSITGISGTGVSYRKKLTGGFSSLIGKLSNKDSSSKNNAQDEKFVERNDSKENVEDIINEYEDNLNKCIGIHKYADKILTETEFDKHISNLENESLKEIYSQSKEGNEEVIESLIGSFLSEFDFAYPISANYELEDEILYVDLDLPEIEDLTNEYPVELKNKLSNKKKTQSQLKSEYANTVVSLSIYLTSEFFNISSYIKEIIISGYTTRRSSDGDKNDEYLYSIKYLRNEFENTDLTKIDDIFKFIDRFENRINVNKETFSFKSIKPFAMPSLEKVNNLVEEAIYGLKELGYKNSTINEILPKLNELKLENSGEYLKEALKLISTNK